MSSEPPEEPHLRAEPNVLSPASPKPLHFPTSTNIPVLEMQMDIGFNQTEAHMTDPAMRNTEVRADFWRDPNEQQQQQQAGTDHPSPYSTGGDALESTEQNGNSGPEEVAKGEEQAADSNDTAVTNAATTSYTEPEAVQISTSTSPNEADAILTSDPTEGIQPSSDPSAPTAEAAAIAQFVQDTLPDPTTQNDQTPQSVFSGNTVDVQALLDTLQPAVNGAAATSSALPTSQSENVAFTLSPSQTQQAPLLPPGVDSSPVSASGLGAPPATGLPPRPPPQEQPLIHPNYVHSQHIRDYHPHAAHPAFQPHTRSASGSQGNVADSNSRNYVPPVHSPSSGSMSAAPGTAGAGGDGFTPNAASSAPFAANTSYPDGQDFAAGAPSAPPQSLAPPQPTYADAYATSPTSAASGWVAVPNSTPAGSMYNPTGQSYNSNTVPQQSYAGSTQQSYAGSPAQLSYGGAGSMPNTAGFEDRRESRDDPRWDFDIQRKYDRFIDEERRYVSEGRWEQFPQGSRLFVGNLSSEKVTKRDIFHVFHTYGDLAQISIKQAYGFVQFLRTEDCQRALELEQGTLIRDKRIHLEVSKPQKNRNQNTQRRSRSPPDRDRSNTNVDRYVSGGARAGNNRGARDGYRPGYRSPSPPRGYRDRYDDRFRPRSRSPPSYSRGGGGGNGRYRSPSPRRDVDDDLPLPRRERKDVPDVQILVLDSLDRDFISWVESAFSSRSVRVDVLLLSPRLSEQAVVRRQILEGVAAVVKLTRLNQNSGKIGLQIFDRRNGAANVTFEEYDGLDPPIAVELVLRSKLTHIAPSQTPSYGGSGSGSYGGQQQQQQYGQQAQYGSLTYGAQQPYLGQQQPPPPSAAYPPSNYAQQPLPQQPPAVPPHLQNLITNMDPQNLHNLITSMTPSQSSANHSASATNPYAAAAGATPTTSAVQQQLQNHPALAGYLQGQVQQQQQQQQGPGGSGGQVNMQEILARLGSYRR